MPDIGDTIPIKPALSATSELPLPGAAPVEPPAPAPEPAPQAAEPQGGDDAPTEGSEGGEGAEGGAEQALEPKRADRRQTLSQRLSEQSAARRAAEAREARLAEMLDRAQQAMDRLASPQQPQTPQAPDPRPQREGFDDPDAYDTALIEWSTRVATRAATAEAERRAAESRAAEERARTEQTQRTEAERVQAAWNERRAKLLEDPQFEDWEDVATSPDLEIPMTMVPAILEADNGPHVLYHLGKNPAEASRIAKLSPMAQAIEIGKMSAKLAEPARPQPRRLAAPIEPVGGRAPVGPKSPEEEPMEEYGARRLKQLRAERTGSVFGRA